MNKHAKALKESEVKFIKKVTPSKEASTQKAKGNAAETAKRPGGGCIPVSGD